MKGRRGRLNEKGDRSGLRTDIAKKAELYLSILDTASNVEELNITGFSFMVYQYLRKKVFSLVQLLRSSPMEHRISW